MDKNQRLMIVGGAAAGLILVVLVVVWRVSASRAESRATELVSASADVVRCFAGDDVKLGRVTAKIGFERRMVAELPDVSTAGKCLLALEVVKDKYDAYSTVWFSSRSSKGKGDKPMGQRFEAAYGALMAMPLKTTTDQVYKREKYASVLKAGEVSYEMYEAARDLLADEGASEQAIAAAGDTRLRTAPKSQPLAPRGRAIATLEGQIDPVAWNVIPADKQRLTLHALNTKGESTVAWSDDTGNAWQSAKGPSGFGGKSELELRVLHAPKGERWLSFAQGAKEAAEVAVGKVDVGAKKVDAPVKVPLPPEGWKRAPGGEREVAVLANGVKVFPVWRIGEKTKDEKKEEEKRKKEWEENFIDKAVQAEMVLEKSRVDQRTALGIDEDHKRIDGVAYVNAGGSEVTVTELEGWGLGAIVPGEAPKLLIGEQEIPSMKMALAEVPSPGQPLGMTVPAAVMKPVNPAFRGSPWYRCVASDGNTYGTTDQGSLLIGMRTGTLDLVMMTALADSGSHMGCGQTTAIVALPYKKDRIFTEVLTVRLGELEGAKVAATSGTSREGYNQTNASAVVPGAIVVAWVAQGFVMYARSENWGTQFLAPEFLSEAGEDGSRITGVHLVGMDARMVATVARETCAGEDKCVTTFEVLLSDDAAKTWKAPG